MELFEQPGASITTGLERCGNPEPGFRFFTTKSKALGHSRPCVRPSRLQKRDDVGAPLKIPLRHPVRIGVIVDGFMIFVRTDHTPNVVAPICYGFTATSPKSGGLNEHLRPRLQEKRLVLRGLPILPDGVRDIGADMVLLLPGED